jgi:hypothetical protein
VSAEESKTLEMSFGEGRTERKKLDADELAVLAAGLEGSHGELSHGDLVWAKVKGMSLKNDERCRLHSQKILRLWIRS